MRLVACPTCHMQFDVAGVDHSTIPCPCGATVDSTPRAAVDADIRRCGSCGALLDAGASTCTYCRSAVVRDARRPGLVCPECYARNGEEVRFCTACGVEFRPQPLWLDGDTGICPVCEERLVPRAIAAIAVQECSRCAGLWVPGEGFDVLVERVLEAQRARPSGIALAERSKMGPSQREPHHDFRHDFRHEFQHKVEYRRCAACRKRMQRRNFARSSGVIVDWCGLHGTWLDADELEHIAAYVLRGGLEAGPGGKDAAAWRQPAGHQQARVIEVAERVRPGCGDQWSSEHSTVFSIGEFLVRILVGSGGW